MNSVQSEHYLLYMALPRKENLSICKQCHVKCVSALMLHRTQVLEGLETVCIKCTGPDHIVPWKSYKFNLPEE